MNALKPLSDKQHFSRLVAKLPDRYKELDPKEFGKRTAMVLVGFIFDDGKHPYSEIAAGNAVFGEFVRILSNEVRLSMVKLRLNEALGSPMGIGALIFQKDRLLSDMVEDGQMMIIAESALAYKSRAGGEPLYLAIAQQLSTWAASNAISVAEIGSRAHELLVSADEAIENGRVREETLGTVKEGLRKAEEIEQKNAREIKRLSDITDEDNERVGLMGKEGEGAAKWVEGFVRNFNDTFIYLAAGEDGVRDFHDALAEQDAFFAVLRKEMEELV